MYWILYVKVSTWYGTVLQPTVPVPGNIIGVPVPGTQYHTKCTVYLVLLVMPDIVQSTVGIQYAVQSTIYIMVLDTYW